jgi:hypothetical protein
MTMADHRVHSKLTVTKKCKRMGIGRCVAEQLPAFAADASHALEKRDAQYSEELKHPGETGLNIVHYQLQTEVLANKN